MSGYAEPATDATIPPPLTSAEISVQVFKQSPGWFASDRVRKRFYAKGFPRPYARGLWSAIAVARWYATAGTVAQVAAPKAAKPPRKGRQRPPVGYADVPRHH